MPDRIERAADLLVEARRSGAKLAAWPSDLTLADTAEAAQIQRAVMRRLGIEIGGWKVALFPDGNGLAAPILTSDISESPAVRRLEPAPGIGIEAEIAFWIADDMRAGRAYDRKDVIGAVGGVSAAIELVESRFRDMDTVPKLAFLADNLANGGLVYGASAPDWQKIDLGRLVVTIMQDGKTLIRQEGGHPLGDPLLPLIWLANHLSETGYPLRAGDIVITGSFTGLHRAEHGQSIKVTIEGPEAARLNILPEDYQ